ncbi:MAG: hypothetical protein IKH57_12850 [Clostridia bacterium]|nr:hypothetical protein [Clostridia bacterium]MBR4359742.1 hypothetical protein [Clostridia bacterium]
MKKAVVLLIALFLCWHCSGAICEAWYSKDTMERADQEIYALLDQAFPFMKEEMKSRFVIHSCGFEDDYASFYVRYCYDDIENFSIMIYQDVQSGEITDIWPLRESDLEWMVVYDDGISFQDACEILKAYYAGEFDQIRAEHQVKYLNFVDTYGAEAAELDALIAKGEFYFDYKVRDFYFFIQFYHPHDLAYGKESPWFAGSVNARTGEVDLEQDFHYAVEDPFGLHMSILIQESQEEYDRLRESREGGQ